jgi:hypothetical protein
MIFQAGIDAKGTAIIFVHVRIYFFYKYLNCKQPTNSSIFTIVCYLLTSGFWPHVRARALRAPVFLGALPRQTGRCAPAAHRSFAASYSSAKKYIFTISRN